MSENFMAFLICWMACGNILVPIISDSIKNFLWTTPSELYKNSRMNKFGCILTSILLAIIAPLNGLCTFLWWLCHVGRRD